MRTDWRSWQSQTRLTGLVHGATARWISAFFAGPARSYAPLFYGRMNLAARSCVNILRELTMIVSSASSRQQSKLTNRSCLRSASPSDAMTPACREGFHRGATNGSDERLRGRVLCRNLRTASGGTIEQVLFTPFRPGTAHIMIF